MSRSPGTIPTVDTPGGYTVVARRYRPQRFEDVVGQDHVVQALRNAIRLNRVTHAYLFSGTRGVGKTSIARIFAKCLNCVQGPTETPCLECDICQAIATGQDVDVIEIDGASNNGVEAVRELRQNAGLRPSRSRFKIYYIDEVHMLSTGAFNALLKTLEEPPEHVKFFFATTEPNKIPITVLSRCQRYDFAGITPDQIAATLGEICGTEGVKADEDALRAIARRASGSMRDAQSLLEQLLSFGGDRLTVELVHQQLGIASDERTLALLDALSQRATSGVLEIVDQSVASGVQPAELLGGTLDFLRDAMVLSAGAGVSLLAATPRQRPLIQAVVDRWPLDTILAAMQILSEARMKLRGSTQGRLIVEVALSRVARLESMTELSEVIARLAGFEADGPAAPVEKKKPVAVEVGPPPAPVETVEAAPAWEIDAIRAAWPRWTAGLDDDFASKLGRLRPTAIDGANGLSIAVDRAYNWAADACDTPEVRPRIEARVGQWLGRPVSVRFERSAEEATLPLIAANSARDESLRADPMVRQLVELFDAKAVRVEFEDGPGP